MGRRVRRSSKCVEKMRRPLDGSHASRDYTPHTYTKSTLEIRRQCHVRIPLRCLLYRLRQLLTCNDWQSPGNCMDKAEQGKYIGFSNQLQTSAVAEDDIYAHCRSLSGSTYYSPLNHISQICISQFYILIALIYSQPTTTIHKVYHQYTQNHKRHQNNKPTGSCQSLNRI